MAIILIPDDGLSGSGPAGWGPTPTVGGVPGTSIPPSTTAPSTTQTAQSADAATQAVSQAIFMPPVPAQVIMALDPTGVLLCWFQILTRKLGGYTGIPSDDVQILGIEGETVDAAARSAIEAAFFFDQPDSRFLPSANVIPDMWDSGAEVRAWVQAQHFAAALGFTPVNKAGDTGIGDLSMAALTATTGSFSGAVSIATAGKSVGIKEGSNAKMGVAILSGGTATVSTTAVAASSRIMLTPQSLGTISRPTGVGVTARTPGTSFVITSSDITDTSTIAWLIIDPL